MLVPIFLSFFELTAGNQCMLCDIVENSPLGLSPSSKDIDQLLLHHVLVKINQLENTINRIQENQRSEKKSKSSQPRISVVEDKILSAFSSQIKITRLEKEVASVSDNLNQMNLTAIDSLLNFQEKISESVRKLNEKVGWEYSRAEKWIGRHGVIVFGKQLLDTTDGAYDKNTGQFVAQVPGMYFVAISFGVTKKIWYVHLRKNGAYMGSVQKDYNQGLESAVTMHALLNLEVGDVVDVFCSNVDIEFRADYNSAKFTGFLVHQQH
ncbi:Oidioi.mRNA.OKI2018_I69.chr2.g8182.t1.cds [Oikopleura dioica]|uniref:Oidioi.mRNA.OKI2018_I69.chr2.g8182.t1.cds n=1 Tax=Oikopleura dioica TaxID=34765 RepID=A0ABN7TEZ1_OIKDI|nr:Oidioi.mRNA.OKI2018_I69.chr2.g8182.t1.cds [Oikopleura dioica]